MAADLRTILIAAGTAAVAAGGVAFLVLRPPAPPAAAPASPMVQPAAAAPAAAATAPASTAAPATALPAQSQTGVEVPPDPAPVGFDHSVKPYSVARDTIVYSAASTNSPHLYPLPAGTPLISAELSQDGKWVISLTEDGRAAYLLTEDLGPFDPAHVPQRLSLPTIVNGQVQVVDTANLVVGGQQVHIEGIVGKTDAYAVQLQSLLASQGNVVTCELQTQAYLCKLPNGVDIGKAVLLNGAAEPADDASADYRQQADIAKAAHRGIWQ